MNSPTAKALARLHDFRAEIESIRLLFNEGEYDAERAMRSIEALCERDVEQAKRDAASTTLKAQAEIKLTCSLCGKPSVGICRPCADKLGA